MCIACGVLLIILAIIISHDVDRLPVFGQSMRTKISMALMSSWEQQVLAMDPASG